MEIPPVVSLDGHQSWTASGLQTLTFSTQTSQSSALSANGSADHTGDGCLPEARSSLLEPGEDVHKLKESSVLDSQNNNEISEAVGPQEPERVTGEAHLDVNPLVSDQLHEGCIESTLPTSNNFTLPEGRSHQVLHNHVGQTEGLNSGCVKTDLEKLEPVSNGHVFRPSEDPTFNLDSSPTLTVTQAAPASGQRVLDLPRIVKHKPSSITFLNYTCPSGAGGHSLFNESSDDGESSPGEEKDDGDHDDGDDDDDDDDVFPELPQSRERLVNHRQRSKDKQKRRGAVSGQAEIDHTARKCGYEAEGEGSSKEVCCY